MMFYGLFGYAYKFVKSKEIAEELVEDVMVIMWEKQGQFDEYDRLKAYLFGVLRNKALDYLKSNSKMMFSEIDNHEIADEGPAVIEEELHVLIYHALDSLPAKCRQVFELSCIEGLKYSEISERMGISINTVKSQRSRAIKLTRSFLDEYMLALYLSFYMHNL